MRQSIAPTITPNPGPGSPDRVITEHPAFGVVTLGRSYVSGGGSRLFASELRHSELMTITVHEACSYRDLNQDRPYADKIVCQLQFSQAQWAAFICSQGIGAGVPCTLTYTRDGSLLETPEIATPHEQHVDRFAREMKEGVESRLAKVREAIAAAAEHLAAGRKAAARDALKDAEREASYTASTAAFVNERFVDATEHVVSAAKAELEGFVVGMAMRTGIAQLATAAPSLDALAAPAQEPQS